MTEENDPPQGSQPPPATPECQSSEQGWPTRDLAAIRRETTPDRLAVVDAPTDERYTYRELDGLVARVGAGLREATGDPDREHERERIAVLAEPSPRFVALVHATWRTGIQLVSLDTRDAPETLAGQLAHVDATTLVVDGEHAELGERVAETVESSVDLERVELAALAGTAADSERKRAESEAESQAFAPDDAPIVLFTSGTTGEPKAVPLTVANLVSSATASAFRLGVTSRDRWLSPLPVSHMGGLAPSIRCALYGATVVLQRAFDTEATADALATHDATGVSLVPTALDRLLDAGWEPTASLRFVLLGGAAASPKLVERCEAAGVPVFPTYGMTETASQIATATPEQAFARPETVGQPLVTTTVRIVDADGTSLGPGKRGEIVVAGPTVTPGYLGNGPDRVVDEDDGDRDDGAGSFSEIGFHTGDVGYRDEEGRLYVTGRLDDVIVTGGENVQPARVERALESLDGVDSAAVVGVPDEEWGERVVALVVPAGDLDARSRDELDAESLREAARGSLAAHERPKSIVLDESIPRTASGTVDREAVRDVVADAT